MHEFSETSGNTMNNVNWFSGSLHKQTGVKMNGANCAIANTRAGSAKAAANHRVHAPPRQLTTTTTTAATTTTTINNVPAERRKSQRRYSYQRTNDHVTAIERPQQQQQQQPAVRMSASGQIVQIKTKVGGGRHLGLTTLLLGLMLALLSSRSSSGTNISKQLAASRTTATLNEPLEQQVTDIRVKNSPVDAFGNLIAMGRTSLGPVSSGGRLTSDSGGNHWRHQYQDTMASGTNLYDTIQRVRLTADQIGSSGGVRPSSPSSSSPSSSSVSYAGNNGQAAAAGAAANKLDYIIDFLKANKLTKFCDLLTSPEAKIKRLIGQLNRMERFTLFVPTNEALLLMPSGQLEALANDADELRHFLMAHVTSELVVPKLSQEMAASTTAGGGSSSPLLLSQLASKYSNSGAQNRWSSGRQLDRIVDEQPSESTTSAASNDGNGLIYSLIGSPLRIITRPVVFVPAASTASGQSGSSSSSSAAAAGINNSTRLELIVNGANVLSGDSHALQEPNNVQTTYAIVHLIDRALYPVATMSLYDKIVSQAPRFGKYLAQSQDQQLIDKLKSTTRHLITAFVPTDDAFRLLQPKLLEQLDSNRTYLEVFLRTHFVDGLFFSGQLAGGTGAASSSNYSSSNFHHHTSSTNNGGGIGSNQLMVAASGESRVPRQLTSLAGIELEFETKLLQSRQLILVNSIPILDQDQMALNGVMHSIRRPIIERHLLDVACNCESKLMMMQQQQDAAGFDGGAGGNSNSSSPQRQQQHHNHHRNHKLFDNEKHADLAPVSNDLTRDDKQIVGVDRSKNSANATSNWFRGDTANSGPPSQPELEREESRTVQVVGGGTGAGNDNQQASRVQYAKVMRTQRSDNNLIARNNRDFYRPSTVANGEIEELRSGASGLSQLSSSSSNSASQQQLGHATVLAGTIVQPTERSAEAGGGTVGQIATNSWTNGRRQPVAAVNNLQLTLDTPAPDQASSFEVDRYKIVLNATTRQKLREQQGLIMASSLNKNNNANQGVRFVYDQPMSTQRTPPASGQDVSSALNGGTLLSYSQPEATLLAQSPNVSSAAPQQTVSADQVSSSASTQRQQRLLVKFQVEDARDQLYNTGDEQQQQTKNIATGGGGGGNQRQFGKTQAPSMGTFNGCAFYDADCKRLVGKLVRLPANLGSSSSKSIKQQPVVSGRPASFGSTDTAPTTPSSAAQFDSTFGETTDRPTLLSLPGTNSLASSQLRSTTPMTPVQLNYQRANSTSTNSSPIRANSSNNSYAAPGGQFGASSLSPLPGRLSSLSQPLPPWSEDEHKQAVAAGSKQLVVAPQGWRPNELVGDIARIQMATSKLSPAQAEQSHTGANSNYQLGPHAVSNNFSQQIHGGSSSSSQQVLMVPVKMFHDSNIQLVDRSRLRQAQQQQQQMANHTGKPAVGVPPVYFAAPQSTRQPQQQLAGGQLSSTTFNSNSLYFTPTVQPSRAHQLGRLTNFTALETVPLEPIDSIPANRPQQQQQQQQQQQYSKLKQQAPAVGSSLSPLAHHRLKSAAAIALAAVKSSMPSVQSNQQQLVIHEHNNNNTSQSSIKQARKIVRLQASPPIKQQQVQDEFEYAGSSPQLGTGTGGGDISVTSAKLSQANLNNKPPGQSNFTLATLASNQLADASFLRPPASGSLFEPEQSSSSAEFFQNRTIAEIMDDSGLRIDGQQVTFNRLHECLSKADLFNLVSQAGSSLTIFLPTDTAFHRLVQQQALLQQRTARSPPTMSARLTDPNRKHLIPLIARTSPGPDDASSSSLSSSSSALPATRNTQTERLQLTAGSNNNNNFDQLIPSASSSSSSALANRLSLDCSSQQARQLLLDHLSAQLITPRQLQTDLVLSTLSGKRLLLSSVPSKKIVVVDGQPVIAATRAKNGMVYVVNKFLNITNQASNVMDLLETQPNLKTFQSYLAFASLTDRLKRETGPLTILAPTNESFEQLSSTARQLINSDPAALMDILRGHIIEGAQFSKLISMRNRLKTLNSDHYIDAKVIKPNVYQLDNQMTSMRLVGTTGNGVVNSIDRLIVPPWLRAATGTNRQLSTGSSGSFSATGTPELPNGDNTGRSQPLLNLPQLNNRPTRFEQLGPRLAPTNSFSLAGGSASGNRQLLPDISGSNQIDNSNNNLAPDFRQPFSDAIDRLRPTPASFNGSPFSRIADNITSSSVTELPLSPPPGGRLTFGSSSSGGSLPSDDSLPRASQNATTAGGNVTTRNMQLIEKLAGLMRARKFVQYLARSGLSSSLKPDMNYVLLIPTDQAMDRLPRQILDMLERDSERLTDLINFHVLDTTFEYINTIPDGQTLNTLNEKDILFNWHRNNTILTASGAVVLGGIQEDNIALLIVDRVLYPTPGDLLSIVTKSPILSNFTNLIRSAGLESQLSLTGPFTLFAPSDFAFNQLDQRDLEFLLKNRDTARRFLLRHLSQPAIFTSSIALSNATTEIVSRRPAANNNLMLQSPSSTSPGDDLLAPRISSVPMLTITNSLGEDLILRQKNDYFSVNDVNFSYADVAATNGVVHVIDGLL